MPEPFVIIGSTNPRKVSATIGTFEGYERFRKAAFTTVDVLSLVSGQPKSLEEVVRGGLNRAQAALAKHAELVDDSDDVYGVGIESGLTKVPYTTTGYMNLTACVIVGTHMTQPAIGLSSAFECPPSVIDDVMKDDKKTITDGFVNLGLTTNRNLGYSEGAIGILTKGRVTREQYMRHAMMMALVQLDFAELYAAR